MVAVSDAAGATVAAIDLEVEALATGMLAHLTAVLALAAPGLSC